MYNYETYDTDTISIIDNACNTTLINMGDYDKKQSHLYLSLINYFDNDDLRGFTRVDNSRTNIRNIGKQNFIKEIIKNVVKKRACALYHYYTLKLSTVKDYKSYDLDVDDCEIIVLDILENSDISDIDFILETNPIFLKRLIQSFCNSRYFNGSFGFDKLDNEEILTPKYKKFLNEIDIYYSLKSENEVKKGKI